MVSFQEKTYLNFAFEFYICGSINLTLLQNIPLRFVKRHFTTDDNKTTLRVSSRRTWTLKYCIRRRDAKLSSGWRKFARDNYLQVGDVCVFELINSTANLLKVVIFRK